MGNNVGKAIKELLDKPEGMVEAQKVFEKLDANKDGQLSLEEWTVASEALWEAIRGGAEERVRNDVRETVARHAPVMKGLISKMAAQAVDLLADSSDPDHREWVQHMFVRADKDASGALSFEEFVRFFREDAQEERNRREAELRDAIATNIDQNNGRISVQVQDGGVSKSVNVDVPGLAGDEIRQAALLNLHVGGRVLYNNWNEFEVTELHGRGYEIRLEKPLPPIRSIVLISSASKHVVELDGKELEGVVQSAVEGEPGKVRLTFAEPINFPLRCKFGIKCKDGQFGGTQGVSDEQSVGHGIHVQPKTAVGPENFVFGNTLCICCTLEP